MAKKSTSTRTSSVTKQQLKKYSNYIKKQGKQLTKSSRKGQKSTGYISPLRKF